MMESAATSIADVHVVWPGGGTKRLARRMDVPVGTVKDWLYRRLSSARRRELARALLDEMDAQDVERTALRRRLAEWAAEP